MLPEAFLKRMENQLGAEYPEFLKSLERPRAVALREQGTGIDGRFALGGKS